jgi:uncharacterized protein YjbJ (UPF0337 family)
MAGTADEMKGCVKEAAGDLTDNKDLKNEGRTDKAAGKAKDAHRGSQGQGRQRRRQRQGQASQGLTIAFCNAPWLHVSRAQPRIRQVVRPDTAI